MGRRRSPGLIVAVALLGAGAVLGVLVAGPIYIEQPRWNGKLVFPTPPQQTMTPAPGDIGGRPAVEAMRVFTVLQYVLFALLALLVLYVLVRLLLRLRLRLGPRGAGSGPLADLPAGEAGGAVDAPVVRRGIARALAALDDVRDPSDAVVQAWLGFEDAAVAAGAARTPSETPTEYAVRIISRFDADRTSAEQLVRLYEDVRFGGRRADAETVATARACLLRLQASWTQTQVPG